MEGGALRLPQRKRFQKERKREKNDNFSELPLRTRGGVGCAKGMLLSSLSDIASLLPVPHRILLKLDWKGQRGEWAGVGERIRTEIDFNCASSENRFQRLFCNSPSISYMYDTWNVRNTIDIRLGEDGLRFRVRVVVPKFVIK